MSYITIPEKGIKPFPETGFVRLPQILAVIPVSKSHWWDGVKSGMYPKSYRLGARVTCWLATDIHKLIQELSSSGDM